MKNLDIYINGERAVYDEKTLSGSILWNFDLTDPGNRKQPYTNNLKLPVMKNQHIFKFANEPGYTGSLPYDRVTVEIIVDGFLLLKNGIGYISSVKDGYYIVSVREQPDIIQTMKDTKLEDLAIADYSIGTANACQTLINSTSKVKADFFWNDASISFIGTAPGGALRLYNTSSNLTFYIADIFTQIATDLSITWAGGLFSDSYFTNMRMVIASAAIGATGSTTTTVMKNIVLNEQKTVFDFFKAVLQTFGAVYTINGSTITVEKFDDITLGSVDWNGKLEKVVSKKFSIPNLAQKNYYRLKPGGDADDIINQALWECNNKNIKDESNIIEPEITCHPYVSLSALYGSTIFTGTEQGIYLPNSAFQVWWKAVLNTYYLITNTTINDFVFVVDGFDSLPVGFSVIVDRVEDFPSTAATTVTHVMTLTDNQTIARYYNSQNDYLRLEAMLADPVMYEVEMNLNVLDLNKYSPFNLASVPELAGDFYVNKLQYNFEKEGRASKVQLIKYVEP